MKKTSRQHREGRKERKKQIFLASLAHFALFA